MQVLFVGTGNAFAAGGRNAMAILLRAHDFGVLLDCGPTTLTALKKLGRDPGLVDAIFLSHHHGDHLAGVPFLVLHEIYESERKSSLAVLGPQGTASLAPELMEKLYPGHAPPSFPLRYCNLEPGTPWEEGPFRVTPFEVDHYRHGTALGFRVEALGRSIVYSGDTGFIDALLTESRDVDLFICECSSYEEPLPRHVSHREISENRSRIGAKRTLLVHPNEEVLEHQDKLAFELARDGMEVFL